MDYVSLDLGVVGGANYCPAVFRNAVMQYFVVVKESMCKPVPMLSNGTAHQLT